MSREPNPDPIELMRQMLDVSNRHDLDALMRLYAPDAVLDMSDLGLGNFDGVAAIRGFIADWWGTWEGHLVELDEIADLGHGVVFVRAREDGRLVGSGGHVEQRRGWIFLWAQGMCERFTAYLDVDEARAAAERLAEERG